MKKRITELRNQIDALEEKFVLDKIDQLLYEKYRQKYQKNINELSSELNKINFDSSNLEKAVNRGLQIAENISQMWVLSDYNNKQRLQNLVFPSGIMYDKETGGVRTENVNSLFASIPLLVKVLTKNKNGNPKKRLPKF